MAFDASTSTGREQASFTPSCDPPFYQWYCSSQRAADLYDQGVKFWTKKTLLEIEEEIAHSATQEYFTLRRIDGTVLYMKNPLHGATKPIWTPSVKFQHYWNLVKLIPPSPPVTHLCTYLVDWKNESMTAWDGSIPGCEAIIESFKKTWDESRTRPLVKAHLQQVLKGRKVTKVVCFGLGDFTARSDARHRAFNAQSKNPEHESKITEDGMIQHWAALTIADALRELSGGSPIRLLAQDPAYVDKTKRILERYGYEIVGQFGAAGFAEVDDETVVFSHVVTAPVKQIIADIARPVCIINLPPMGEFISPSGVIGTNPESPRTVQMMQEYEASDFPTAPEDGEVMKDIGRLTVYTRTSESPSNSRPDASSQSEQLQHLGA